RGRGRRVLDTRSDATASRSTSRPRSSYRLEQLEGLCAGVAVHQRLAGRRAEFALHDRVARAAEWALDSALQRHEFGWPKAIRGKLLSRFVRDPIRCPRWREHGLDIYLRPPFLVQRRGDVLFDDIHCGTAGVRRRNRNSHLAVITDMNAAHYAEV